MKLPCGCCEGIEAVTPIAIANRPGLSALAYRVGTHATFLETMKALLSSSGYPALAKLRTRDSNDPAIAFLDAWATVADVLTFYQERIANEGYLRTATERRSVLELANVVGYSLRPGVSASVYLAFTLENTAADDTIIPVGTRAQSLPEQGQLPQSFETAENLKTRVKWNAIKPRLTQPQKITLSDDSNSISKNDIYFQGTATNLKPNDPLLFVFSDKQILHYVKEVEVQVAENRTKVSLQEPATPPSRESSGLGVLATTGDRDTGEQSVFGKLTGILEPLSRSPSLQPANSLRLSRDLKQTFASTSDTLPQLLTSLQPTLQPLLYQAWQSLTLNNSPFVKVYALRIRASVFGHNAPLVPTVSEGEITDYREWDLKRPPQNGSSPILGMSAEEPRLIPGRIAEEPTVVWLDASYEKILPTTYSSDSWIVLERPNSQGATATAPSINQVVISKVKEMSDRSKADYGISGKSTRIQLQENRSWIDPQRDNFSVIRGTAVYAQSEELTLAEEPITTEIGLPKPNKELALAATTTEIDAQQPDPKRIELDGLYDGLEVGKWVIVSGDRADVPGVKSSELVMLAGVEQTANAGLPGDKPHTTLILANEGLAYSYKRDTVSIYANVIKATHGETRTEVLGSGDGSKGFQRFDLRQMPLTYLAAPTPVGAASTLQVRVNDILWHEVDSLASLSHSDRNFITRTDESGKTTVIFGNGKNGARLPTGTENVKAFYRNGIGKVGNVKPEQISLLATRPLGVKSVINPLAATGGADPESRDRARHNAPLAVMSLDRLVSVRDYADFTRTFAGIGKASARLLSDGRRQSVHLTIAGADDIPISPQSDLYQNLVQALRQYGDPQQPFQVEVRELVLLIINAQVQLLPDYLWEAVASQIRSKMLDAFSFERRELGQSVFLSEVISTMQQVPGVAYVDVDVFGGLPEKTEDTQFTNGGKRQPLTPTEIQHAVAEILQRSPTNQFQEGQASAQTVPPAVITVNLADVEAGIVRPAQIAYLSPNIPDTLTLTERKP